MKSRLMLYLSFQREDLRRDQEVRVEIVALQSMIDDAKEIETLYA